MKFKNKWIKTIAKRVDDEEEEKQNGNNRSQLTYFNEFKK